jgi:hypothetical protein
MHAMIEPLKGRPPNEDWYWWMRPLMKKADNEHKLSRVCSEAGCLRGRKSIRDWLYGREDGPKDEAENPILRALPNEYAVALMGFLLKHYPEESIELRTKAGEWFEAKKAEAKKKEDDEHEAWILGMANEFWEKGGREKWERGEYYFEMDAGDLPKPKQ